MKIPYMWLLRFSAMLLFLLFGPLLVQGQSLRSKDMRPSWVPRAVIISTEVSELIRPWWCDCGRAMQLEGQLLLKHVFAEGQLGQATRTPVRLAPLEPEEPLRSDEDYSSVGYFWRAGLGLIISSKDGVWSATAGFHYAQAEYTEEMQLRRTDPVPVVLRHKARHVLEWQELSLGIKLNLWQGIMVGYRIRMLLNAVQKIGSPHIDSFYAPGYGQKATFHPFGVHYYVGYRIPLSRP